MSNSEIMKTLEQIFQSEVAGMNRYLHYSFMIMGHNRIPIQKWLRDQAVEAMNHATTIGEKITSYEGHPPITGPNVEESNVHTIDQILKESLGFEERGVELYKRLAQQAEEAKDYALEELAREFIRTETEHVEEVKKMLRSPN